MWSGGCLQIPGIHLPRLLSMTRHPLIRIFLVPLLVLCGCGGDSPPAPPTLAGPRTIAAVRVFPPRSVLRGAPEVLVIDGDSVRLDVDLGQDFMPGDAWGLEEGGGGSGRVVAGHIAPRPERPGTAVMDAWIIVDDRIEGMQPNGWAGPGRRPAGFDSGLRSAHPLERLDTIDVVVRLRMASGQTRFLQRRRVQVMISE